MAIRSIFMLILCVVEALARTSVDVGPNTVKLSSGPDGKIDYRDPDEEDGYKTRKLRESVIRLTDIQSAWMEDKMPTYGFTPDYSLVIILKDPGEWKKIMSNSASPGDFYYENRRTGEKQWQKPKHDMGSRREYKMLGPRYDQVKRWLDAIQAGMDREGNKNTN